MSMDEVCPIVKCIHYVTLEQGQSTQYQDLIGISITFQCHGDPTLGLSCN